MILSVLLASQAIQGASFPFKPVVLDTTLVKSKPKDNFGREEFVLGGDGRVALLKFPDLQYLRPKGQKIKSATLVLNLALPDPVGEIDVRRVLRSWGEGRGRTIPNMATVLGEPAAFGSATWESASFGDNDSKWTAGGASNETDSRSIDGIAADQAGRVLKLSGFKTTVQGWIDNPLSNYGMRLTFSQDAAFMSGETPQRPSLEIEWEDAPSSGPDLALVSLEPTARLDPKAPSSWVATVMNRGADAEGVKASWTLPSGRTQTAEIPVTLAGGSQSTIKLDLPVVQNYGDPRRAQLSLSVSALDEQNPADNTLTVPIGGTTISVGNDQSTILLAQQALRFLNDVALPFSRSSFAPEGITERLRLVTASEPDVRLDIAKVDAGNPPDWPWQGVDFYTLRQIAHGLVEVPASTLVKQTSGVISITDRGQIGTLSDTRDDALRFRGLSMPSMDWYIPRPVDPPLRESGFFSRVEAGFLQSNIGKTGQERSWNSIKLPSGVVLSLTDTQGNAIDSGEVEFAVVNEQGEVVKSYGKSKLARGGIVSSKLDGTLNLQYPWLELKLIRAGNTEVALVSIWDLYDWVIRGNKVAAAVDVRMMVSDVELSLDSDLAENKVLTDSAGRFPAEIGAIVDPASTESVSIAPGGWIEIDLGRDRTFGGVELEYNGSSFEAVEIYTFKTGQSPAEARAFFRDPQAGTTARLFGQAADGLITILYKSASVQSRYIRIINAGASAAKLKRIKVRPAKSGSQ